MVGEGSHPPPVSRYLGRTVTSRVVLKAQDKWTVAWGSLEKTNAGSPDVSLGFPDVKSD